MNRVIVDGQWADASSVRPETHRYVGAFRPPNPPTIVNGPILRCSCGANLRDTDAHWRLGHFDVLQYTADEVSGGEARLRLALRGLSVFTIPLGAWPQSGVVLWEHIDQLLKGKP